MKKHFIHILLLCALFFNISHASIIAMTDECDHESVQAYVMEQSQSSECGDLCDLTYLFNFIAIVETPLFTFTPLKIHDAFVQKSVLYTPPYNKTNIKPPIV